MEGEDREEDKAWENTITGHRCLLTHQFLAKGYNGFHNIPAIRRPILVMEEHFPKYVSMHFP